MKKLVRYFLQGLVVFSPALITLSLLLYAFNYIDDKANYLVVTITGYRIYGVGIALTLIFITLLGFLSSTVFFRGIFRWFEGLLLKGTFVRMVYTSIKDLFNAFVGDKKKFNKPVLVTMYRGGGIYKLGFITQNDMEMIDEKDKLAVYLPHSYNFSGNLFIVEADLVKPINISSTEAMKFIVSGGITHLDKTAEELKDIRNQEGQD